MDLLASIQAQMENLESELIEQLKGRVPVTLEIGGHIMHSGGKRIRPQLAIISARMGGYHGPDALKDGLSAQRRLRFLDAHARTFKKRLLAFPESRKVV